MKKQQIRLYRRFSLILVIANASLCTVYKVVSEIIHFENFAKNQHYPPLIRNRTCLYQGVKNVTFTEDFEYTLNEWFLACRELFILHTAEAHLEPRQTFKMEAFA